MCSTKQILSKVTSDVALVIMARSPFGEQAPKTRLADAINTALDRRRLYSAFLEDTVVACRGVEGTILRVAYTPDGGNSGFHEIGVANHELLPQRGVDLGAREHAVFVDLFAAGFRKVIMIGSDLPTLPMQYVVQAIDQIQVGTVALGPSDDGGYYLIGLTSSGTNQIVDLFTGIGWGTASAFHDTLVSAKRLGLQVKLVPHWYDVDNKVGLIKLRREFQNTSAQQRAPQTARVIKDIFSSATAERRRKTE